MDAGAGRVQPLRPSAARAVLRGALDGLQHERQPQLCQYEQPHSPLLICFSSVKRNRLKRPHLKVWPFFCLGLFFACGPHIVRQRGTQERIDIAVQNA